MQNNKIFSALLSVILAFGLWMYVITVDNPDYRDTIHGIPVVFTGETALNEKGLILAVEPNATVDLTLSGSRSEVVKCDKSNITVKVDLSKIYDEGIHNLEYSYSFPADVAASALSVDSKYPGTIAVSIAKWSRKEVPVTGVCQGTVSEGFIADTENVTKDYAMVAIQGPASVVEQIQEALINVDLTDQKESISQSFRYTLVDGEGQPVNAESIEVDVEEIYLEVKIQCVKSVNLVINLVDGGGATAQTAVLEYEPRTILVSGSEAVLADLDEIVLTTINLADYLEPQEFTFKIPELEGVTNLRGVTEINAKLSFPSLIIREFTIENFEIVGLPEGMQAELITEKLPVKIRGLYADMSRLNAENIVAKVDFTGAQIGTSTFKVTMSFGDEFLQLGAVGTNVVTATVTQQE